MFVTAFPRVLPVGRVIRPRRRRAAGVTVSVRLRVAGSGGRGANAPGHRQAAAVGPGMLAGPGRPSLSHGSYAVAIIGPAEPASDSVSHVVP